MATIKIYDSNESTIEFLNEGEVEPGEMQLSIDHCEHTGETLYFHLTKEDAKEVILYLKKQFSINPS